MFPKSLRKSPNNTSPGAFGRFSVEGTVPPPRNNSPGQRYRYGTVPYRTVHLWRYISVPYVVKMVLVDIGDVCLDLIFTLKQLIRKCVEHGLDSWLLFIDLVKAFDRVPRELLWNVLQLQGVPNKLISLLKAMHKSVKVKFGVDRVEQVIEYI